MESLNDKKIAVIERWLEAYNAHDVEAMCAVAAPDLEVRPTKHFAPLGTTYHGAEGVRTLVEQELQRFPGAGVGPRTYRSLGAWVLTLTTLYATDPQVRRTVALLFEVEDGLIRSSQGFEDEREALAAHPPGLTPRELEVFQLLAEGLNAPQIADRLFLSPATVRTHIRNGVERLGANTRIHAIAMAVARGEIRL
jgi:DNA-binding CsgD family transcriptional regulator